ncbi:MAG TPA: NmrA family NAD(P)-binding protein [Ignavibacteriales bacterium]|nr:NmrA family NAD(P)-binding protein [Ignavibacteriales bacterium]
MNIVLGASGQIGSMLVDNLLEKDPAIKAVVRSASKAQALKAKGIKTVIADFMNADSLKDTFAGGSSLFMLTPENPASPNHLKDIKTALNNIKEAVLLSGLKRITGLSSMGAHNGLGRGSLEASYLLEHTFDHINIRKIFVRPSYYFSNWLGYVELVKEHGALPTFFPPDMKIPMVAPQDAAAFLARAMTGEFDEGPYEISGPREYSSAEIADVFGKVLNRSVAVQQIMPEDWEGALLQAGFTKDGAKNLMLMTQAVIDGKTDYETKNPVYLSMDFEAYLKKASNEI